MLSLTDALSLFCAGLLTLGLEMSIGRLLYPYLGSSILPWASLIAVVLTSFSLSYLFIQNRILKGRSFSISNAFILGSISCAIALLIRRPLQLALQDQSLLISTLSLHLLLAGVPAFFWAMILPLVQSQYSKPGPLTLAISTLGNLMGVFLVALYLIPAWGPTATTIALSLLGLLLGLSLRLLGRFQSLPAQASTLSLIILTAVFFYAKIVPYSLLSERTELIKIQPGEVVLEFLHTPYQSVAVTQDTQGYRYLWYQNLRQFGWCGGCQNQLTHDPYALALVTEMQKKEIQKKSLPPKRVLVIGAGSGVISHQIEQILPDAIQTTVELDRQAAQIALKWLPLGMLKKTEIVYEDARRFLEKDHSVYDWIILDVYLHVMVPQHLMTREFVRLLASHLSPQGVLGMNWQSLFDLNQITADWIRTLQTGFSQVEQTSTPGYLNRLIIAQNIETSDEPVLGHIFTDEKNDLEIRSWPMLQKVAKMGLGQ